MRLKHEIQYETHCGAAKMSFRRRGDLLPCLWLHFIVSISIHAIELADLERAQRGECYAL
jgi:hypothetical protein